MMTLQDVHERNTAYNSPHIDLKIVISGLRDTMVGIRKLLWALLLLPVGGYRLLQMKLQPDNFIKKLAAGAMGLGLLLPNANAMETSNPIPESMRYITERNVKPLPYYFGVGCFWHVQHEVDINSFTWKDILSAYSPLISFRDMINTSWLNST